MTLSNDLILSPEMTSGSDISLNLVTHFTTAHPPAAISNTPVYIIFPKIPRTSLIIFSYLNHSFFHKMTLCYDPKIISSSDLFHHWQQPSPHFPNVPDK